PIGAPPPEAQLALSEDNGEFGWFRDIPCHKEILSLFAGFKEFVKLMLRACTPKTGPRVRLA
ncbi:MAG: hypothetical protein KJ822_14255, partial [Proteobacteria bacterium]|nr:hypothetical protein [Pseudomonadota bacterium]